ncbi:MAG: NADH-quinone oxidoreductase subunit NuoG, partial [Cyclobacteriaceae bacterium]|nr:NADH-quinone oxidoreductase subunit NuoG [Cyclobacteriaceae bacterium]
MAKIYIDDIVHETTEGKNILEVCLSLGYDLPYFCWHPALGSVGACRQCAVTSYEDEHDRTGKLIMACMEPVRDGTRISMKDRESFQFRKNVIEWLMTNHPHDCPVCDEGGECHLQDMTVMTGHNYRRFVFNKRTYKNQYLGPLINHEMNRCIQCYRCVRFYRDYAEGDDLNVFAAHNHVYFGRYKDGVLQNEFSGNLVEVCPTGVFTDKTLKKHYTRKWDLTSAPSVCVHCGLGCNIIAGERYGSLRRILSRYNHDVNGYFICDRGRFGYEFVNHPEKIKTGWEVIDGGKPVHFNSPELVAGKADDMIAGFPSMIGIGSPRASLESNFALKRLVGESNFYAGIGIKEFNLLGKIQEILTGPVRSASLHDVRNADAALVLGEDLTNTAPMMALDIRKAARNKPMKKAGLLKIPSWHDSAVRELMQSERGPVCIATPHPTKLDDIANRIFRGDANKIARFGFSIAEAIDPEAGGSGSWDEFKDQAGMLAGELLDAENPVIVSGMSLMNEQILEAAANIAWALNKKGKSCSITFTVPECNSMGLRMMADQSLDDLVPAGKNNMDLLIILENDLFRRISSASVDRLRQNSGRIIVLDHLLNPTVQMADMVIPSGSFAESDGTFINHEGRAQRFYQVYVPEEPILESWRWISKLAAYREKTGGSCSDFDDFINLVADSDEKLRSIRNITPMAGFRKNGQKIAREPARHSGRTAMNAGNRVSEPKPPSDPDSPLSFSMEGYHGKPPSSIIPYFWSPGWNSPQAVNKFQIEVGGPLQGGDPGIRLFEPRKEAGSDYFPGNQNDREITGAPKTTGRLKGGNTREDALTAE